jgi:hypothetical protein
VSVCNGQLDHILNIVWWSRQIRWIQVGQYNSVSNIIWVVLSDVADTNRIFTQGKHWLARHGIKYCMGGVVGLGGYGLSTEHSSSAFIGQSDSISNIVWMVLSD